MGQDPHELSLVTVFEAYDSFALSLAKASLEDAGIEFVVSGDTRRIGPTGLAFLSGETAFNSRGCACQIQVSSEDEAEARALLEPLQNPDSAGAGEAELERDQ